MEVSIAEIAEIIEAVQAVKEVVDIINENTDEAEVIPQEVFDVLETFTDGEEGTNDIEILLQDIRDSLVVYDDKGNVTTTAVEQLMIIDKRLDTEFTVLNNAFSLLLGGVAFFIIWTLLTFLFNRIKNL